MLMDIASERSISQADIIRAIEEGAIPGISPPEERIDTPLNHVFLSGDHAYKLKRAIKLPFVDFRQPHQRRAACEAELAVNRRLGSPFYLGVIGVAWEAGSFVLTSAAEALEWLVIMKRFDQRQRFDVMAVEGRLGSDQAAATAAAIATMHAKAPVSRTAGHAADYRTIMHTLRRTEEDAAAALGLSAGAADLYDRLEARLSQLDPLLENRRALGRVRRVHGDLHLRNLCMWNGRPVPFDALEFDERMATTDVLYDLAFFLMDLRRMGLRREANVAMNRYWDVSRESECALALLPFFMALRAAVRRAIAVEEGQLELAAIYQALALKLLDHSSPASVAIAGLSGTGKTALARELAPMLPGPAGARVLSSDVLRKRALGLDAGRRAHPNTYAPARRSEVYRELMARAVTARKFGASIVLDATFQMADHRESLAATLPDAHQIWLDAPAGTRLERIATRRSDASDADAAVASVQQVPACLEEGWHRLDARLPSADLAELVLDAIA